jgi:hypothetical protein
MTSLVDDIAADLMHLLAAGTSPVPTRYMPYNEASEGGTIDAHFAHAQSAWKGLGEALKAVDPIRPITVLPQRLDALSIDELVSEEIDRIIANEPSRPFSEPASNGLKSFQLKESMDRKYIDDLRLQLPMKNSVGYVCSESPYLADPQPVVSVQIYRRKPDRELKILEIDFSPESSLLELFVFVTDLFPNLKMLDGPLYRGSGALVVGDTIYVRGPGDYAGPYKEWLKGKLEVKEMHATCIGELSDNVCVDREACFILFCGDERLELFFSNLALKPPGRLPCITYCRKIPRIVRCILCTTKAADLLVVNDERLPLNPGHCCANCYRRFRADGNGEFEIPDSSVIVSAFFQI